jgi:integrase/recombinase XerD
MTPGERTKIDLLIAQFVEAMQSWNFSPRTIDGYRRDLGAFFDWLAAETDIGTIAAISAETVSAYQIALMNLRRPDGQPLAAQTQALRLVALKSFLGWLAREGKLLLSPAQAIQFPRRHRALPQPLITAKEAIRILEGIDTSTPLGSRDRAIVEVLYATGIRNSELGALTVPDFDRESQTLTVRQGKGGKQRVVPLGPIAAAVLSDYIASARPQLLAGRDAPQLFLSFRGNRLRRDSVAEIVAHAAEAAGINKPVRPHRLRHACATHMLQGGADVRHIQELLGHRSLQTTQLYTKVEIADLKRAHRKFHPREQQAREAMKQKAETKAEGRKQKAEGRRQK